MQAHEDTVVTPGPKATPERIFDVSVPEEGAAPSVVVSGLEIAGGIAGESNGYFGGDMYNAGKLTLTEDWVTDATASSGGGVSNDTGTLLVQRSLVSANQASTGGGDSGGIQNHGSAVCDDTCVPGKKAILTVEDSTVAFNQARLGGGIFSWSDAADGNEVSVIDSTIADNADLNEPGGGWRGPGAGLLVSDGTADVAGSILAHNYEINSDEEYVPTNCATSEAGKISLGRLQPRGRHRMRLQIERRPAGNLCRIQLVRTTGQRRPHEYARARTGGRRRRRHPHQLHVVQRHRRARRLASAGRRLRHRRGRAGAVHDRSYRGRAVLGQGRGKPTL